MTSFVTRRRILQGLSATAGGVLLSGCDRLGESETFGSVLSSAEKLTYRAQRLVMGRNALAREFSTADMSPVFRSNGNTDPRSSDYQRHRAENFVVIHRYQFQPHRIRPRLGCLRSNARRGGHEQTLSCLYCLWVVNGGVFAVLCSGTAVGFVSNDQIKRF